MSSSNTITLVSDIWQGIVDLVYPPKCLVCGDMQASYLCAECEAKINMLDGTACPKCALPRLESLRCPKCAEQEFSFDSAMSVGIYEDVLKDAVHQMKYSGHRVMAPVLARLMLQALRGKHWVTGRCGCIVAVPMHPAKERQRGFNQSELIAKEVGRVLALPVLTGVLVRSKSGVAQVGLSLERRMENVIGAFSVKRRDAVDGRNVMLIDDVLTTGSTAESAAFALREAGAKEVHVVTVARSV